MTMGKSQKRSLRINWHITNRCNYRCAYCWFDPHWEALYRDIPAQAKPEQWLACWERLSRIYGKMEFEIIGGEPFTYPRFVDVLAALSPAHAVQLTTNLSASADELRDLADRCRLDNIVLSASYHPHFVPFAEFFEKVAFLNGRGMHITVNFVTYPPFLDQLQTVQARCDAVGSRLNVWAFTGRYGGRDYPQAYSRAERDLLKDWVPADRYTYNLERKWTRGKLCHAGHLYLLVKADGTASRCGGAFDKEIVLGNIFDPAFAPLNGPAPCPVDCCVCWEFIYLAEEMAKKDLVSS